LFRQTADQPWSAVDELLKSHMIARLAGPMNRR
jgi:hypothetical protein